MSSTVDRFDDRARRAVGRAGRTIAGPGEIVRHPVYTRVLHWAVAIFFLLALLSGFAIYTPWLYRWLTPIFGGGPRTRLLHPWFSLGFVLVFVLQFLNWLRPMTWNASDTQWMRNVRAYASNTVDVEPEDVGFFNGGQKLYFWIIAICVLVFLVTGIPMWFPEIFGRGVVAISYVLHDLAGLVMLGSFALHIYEATFGQPGTFQSMTRGTVARRWAWTHHPAWYRDATGRDPRADYERAKQAASERAERAERADRVERDDGGLT
jgi:formate dehydrogenase subunit gamma